MLFSIFLPQLPALGELETGVARSINKHHNPKYRGNHIPLHILCVYGGGGGGGASIVYMNSWI